MRKKQIDNYRNFIPTGRKRQYYVSACALTGLAVACVGINTDGDYLPWLRRSNRVAIDVRRPMNDLVTDRYLVGSSG